MEGKKKNVLTLNGSTSSDSTNAAFLKAFSKLFASIDFDHYPDLTELPVYRPETDAHPLPPAVIRWREQVRSSDAVIISTPAYLRNIPAALKNAFEWLSTSGELSDKPVLAFTFTPHPPRGKEAMQSLLWTLEALNARVIAYEGFYLSDFEVNDGQLTFPDDFKMMFREIFTMLVT